MGVEERIFSFRLHC